MKTIKFIILALIVFNIFLYIGNINIMMMKKIDRLEEICGITSQSKPLLLHNYADQTKIIITSDKSAYIPIIYNKGGELKVEKKDDKWYQTKSEDYYDIEKLRKKKSNNLAIE